METIAYAVRIAEMNRKREYCRDISRWTVIELIEFLQGDWNPKSQFHIEARGPAVYLVILYED